MEKTNESVRKTVYLEEKLVRQAEILFSEAEVESFWNCKYHIVFAPKYRRSVYHKACH